MAHSTGKFDPGLFVAALHDFMHGHFKPGVGDDFVTDLHAFMHEFGHGADVVITLDAANTVTLVGTPLASMTQDDLSFIP